MATQRDIKERRRAARLLLKNIADYNYVVEAIVARYGVSDRTAKSDIKYVREHWWDDAGDYLFDTRIEYDVLGELLGVARNKGDASLAASLSQQRSRLRKEMQQYERLQSSGLEDPGLSNTLAAALSDLNGIAAPE